MKLFKELYYKCWWKRPNVRTPTYSTKAFCLKHLLLSRRIAKRPFSQWLEQCSKWYQVSKKRLTRNFASGFSTRRTQITVRWSRFPGKFCAKLWLGWLPPSVLTTADDCWLLVMSTIVGSSSLCFLKLPQLILTIMMLYRRRLHSVTKNPLALYVSSNNTISVLVRLNCNAFDGWKVVTRNGLKSHLILPRNYVQRVMLCDTLFFALNVVQVSMVLRRQKDLYCISCWT